MAVYFPLTKSHKEGLLLHSHTQLLSSNIMGYRMHQDKEYTRQGRAEQRRVRAWRVGLNKFEQHKMFIEAEWQWSERSCKVFWSRVFWSRVVFKEVQRVTWGSHTTGSSFAPGAAAQPPVCLALFSLRTLLHFPDPPIKGLIWIIEKGAAWPPVCLALFSLWTLLHMYFSWYPQSAYSMATFLLLWSVWILLWLWNEKYVIYGSRPIFCIKQHYISVKFSNCKRSWYCGKSWYYQRNSHHEEARMHEG